MRVLVVAGARPNFMKVAPILAQVRGGGHEGLLVHTGQHYDPAMSDAFFRELDLAPPDFQLRVGSGSHAEQTARVMERFEPVLARVRPDWVVVVGDVNSTLACALVAAKLRRDLDCRIAHVEAGLRSHDRDMPEEINRVLTDRLSDLLLTPSEDAAGNLAAEGIDASRVRFVGNVMIDTLHRQLAPARGLNVLQRYALEAERFALATLHRPSNVDDEIRLRILVEALRRLSQELPVVLPLHPRTRGALERFNLLSELGCVRVLDPLGYREVLALQDSAAVVLTDSGGVQEETTALGVPCVTVRESTERPITVTEGTNRLVPWPPTVAGIVDTACAAASEGRIAPGARVPRGWDGAAAGRIVAALEETLSPGTSSWRSGASIRIGSEIA